MSILNFPTSPSAGDLYAFGDYTYRYDGEKWTTLSLGNVATLRKDLTNPDKGAAMVARGVVAVDSIADLLALPEGQRREDLGYLVKGFYKSVFSGGGFFTYDPSMPWSEHDGGVIIASGALQAWGGQESDLISLLTFTGAGAGCWVRQFGRDADYNVRWFGTTGTAKDTDWYAFDAAKRSKSKLHSGGRVNVPVGEYQFVKEFVCSDYITFAGEDRRRCRIIGKPGLGQGMAVVRACKQAVGSGETPGYLSHTGFTNFTINGSGSWDVGLYVRHCTNESVFDDVTVQNCKTANSNFIGIFYVSVKNHVSRDAQDLGVVIGKKLFGEGGLNEVNFTAFNNLRGNYAGLDDSYHPVSNPYKGACVTIWSANACAFDTVAGENAFGVGVVMRRGVDSVIPNIYVEANGKGTHASTSVGVRVINADFPVLKIGMLFATRNQKIHLEQDVVIAVDELYSETFASGIFEGAGRVILSTGHGVNNLTEADRTRVLNIATRTFGQYSGVAFSNYASLDNTVMHFVDSVDDVRVVLIPRVTVTAADPILIGMSNNRASGQVLNFGTNFTEGTPVVRRFNSVSSGFGRLRHISNTLPSVSTGIAFDIFVMQPICGHRVVYGTSFR